MSVELYSERDRGELILRDYLAVDRTVLANQRTLLGYIRTTLALLAAGASFIQFFECLTLKVLGWALILLAAVLFVVGGMGFLRMRAKIEHSRGREHIGRPWKERED